MKSNLKAEMARKGVRNMDIQKVTGLSPKSVLNKLRGTSEFSVREALEIQKTFFPALDIAYLFAEAAEGGEKHGKADGQR